MKRNYVYGEYFEGNKVSQYGIDNGYVDYRTLAKAFDCVMNNSIITNTQDIGYWEEYNGSEYDPETDKYTDVFQYFIISEYGAELLRDMTDEIVWYNDALDMYVWGVTHWGTSWDYVLTDIRCNVGCDYKPENDDDSDDE